MPAHINYNITPIIFYKFVCENEEIKSYYVGHTININRRNQEHKSRCNNANNEKYNTKIYQTIRKNGGFDKWKIVEIYRQICLDKSEACKIEQEFIEKLQANMNTYYATRTKEQYVLDNKKEIHNQKKQFRLENKEKITQEKKEYYLKNREKIILKKKEQFICECGGKYIYGCKARHLKTKIHTDYLATINNIHNI